MLAVLLALPALVGCHAGRSEGPTSTNAEEFTVDVLARVVAPGSPAAWFANATAGRAAERALLPGECVPADEQVAAPLPPRVQQIRLDGPSTTAVLQAASGWRTRGGLRMGDPAWTVSDLVWSSGDAAGPHTVPEAVRFGPAPEVRAVSSDADGVRLRWDPLSVDAGEVDLTSTVGELRCGVGSAGVVLPSWVVPASREVRLRSVRESTTAAAEGLHVRVRAIIERVVPLDEAPAEIAPAEPRSAPRGPALGPIRGGAPRPVRG